MRVIDENRLRDKFDQVLPWLDELQRRVMLAAEAVQLGRGGVALVARTSGVSPVTINKGLRELHKGLPAKVCGSRLRAPGAGRKESTELQPGLVDALESLMEPDCREVPHSPLRWSCTGTRQLAAKLSAAGFTASHQLVHRLLTTRDYRLQAKSRKRSSGPEPAAQFRYIAHQADHFRTAGQPVLVLDMKKKNLLGTLDELQESLIDEALDRDTATFAVEAVGRWWRRVGRELYSNVEGLMISAGGAELNLSWAKTWQLELARLAQEQGLVITVCHLPTGTMKWTGLEHQLASHVTMHWQGRPLLSHDVVVSCLTSGKTHTVEAQAAPEEENQEIWLAEDKLVPNQLKLRRHEFHGEWNYTLHGILPDLNHFEEVY